MKEIEYIVHAWDDVVFAESGEKVPADQTGVTLSFNGETVEFDLSEKSIHEIRGQLDYLFTMGTPAKRKPGQHKRPVHSGNFANVREERAAMRAFADEHGLPYHKTASGYDYSKKLRDQWADHLATLPRPVTRG